MEEDSTKEKIWKISQISTSYYPLSSAHMPPLNQIVIKKLVNSILIKVQFLSQSF